MKKTYDVTFSYTATVEADNESDARIVLKELIDIDGLTLEDSKEIKITEVEESGL